eukprot:Filipodium_phascolosomae@DN3382_c0_g1_i1.p1
MGGMDMTFYWGYEATILFSWWKTSRALEFYLSCLIIFLISFGVMWLRYTKKSLEAFWEARLRMELSSLSQPQSHDLGMVSVTNFATFANSQRALTSEPIPWRRNIVRAIFTTFLIAIDFALMLITMTFNAGLFWSVVLGFGFGSLVFGHLLVRSNEEVHAGCCDSQHV